ncbi:MULTISPECIES: HAD family phosphatase [Mycobacteriaceae]|uniref:HAD family hydrolase n=1 Tax=Mycobacteriaceae TaxID=1762 RepID=UPI0008000009|nr:MULTISPECIES: HAD family phosphatase [Mycobacteriaceae]MCK0174396.1 HAD family phosphatase [Mycolicibacterium sp. F2034L]OBB60281.1 HAD family hydrolase [Mycobacterium sp. 852013-51886_SCH5428379]
MKAVLWDMDGTLVDSEKLWDVSLGALYRELGGEISTELRMALVGSSAENTIRTIYADLGLAPDPAAMAASDRWLHDYTGELFATRGLPWCDGARELLEDVAAAGIPMALVTNTQRELTEQALESIGRHFFVVTVCGDEVAQGKPAPDPYRKAADLLGVDPARCLAVEDSPTGTQAAETAGCPVLVVPNDVPVPTSPRRRQVDSLRGFHVDDLREIHRDVVDGFARDS